ncbi:MAG: D-erythronate dehydrogenase [Pseudomonadota bacterium]
MRVMILGGGGMVGQKLAQCLTAEGMPGGARPDITATDIGFPPAPAPVARQDIRDITHPTTAHEIAAARYDVIYQLASVVSGEAEADFAKGWQVNLWPMWQLLEALRAEHEASGGRYRPRLVFTSSIAVFGGPYPEAIPDDFLAAPQTSYGAQKAACEMLVQDFSRKGYVDGMSLRLPTICVRPGAPNAAASSFFSGIIREPLNGETAPLPVPDTVRHSHASPRAAARFLRHAAGLDTGALAGRTALNLPGVSVTVAEQIEALARVAGSAVAGRIVPAPDDDVLAIVRGWPERFDPVRARALGFRAEESFDEIIETYIADDLPHDPRQQRA